MGGSRDRDSWSSPQQRSRERRGRIRDRRGVRMRCEPVFHFNQSSSSTLLKREPYCRSHIYRTNITMILGASLGTARGGLLPDYAHGLVACLILRLVRVRVGNFRVLSRDGEALSVLSEIVVVQKLPGVVDDIK